MSGQADGPYIIPTGSHITLRVPTVSPVMTPALARALLKALTAPVGLDGDADPQRPGAPRKDGDHVDRP